MLVKPPPRQLEPEVVESVWPGDDAVDLSASDLVTWCREGGSAGLVMKPGKTPTVIRYRPLSVQALNRVMSVWVGKEIGYLYTAFRHGLLGIKGERLSWERFGDVRGLSDSSLEELSEFKCELPVDVLSEALIRASTQQPPEREVSLELSPTPLPEALGYQILALTFRRRGDRA